MDRSFETQIHLHKNDLDKILWHCKACTKHELQSLHKVRPSTTLYSKLAQSMSQYYFVLRIRSLHKTHPSTTLYYKPCTENFQYYFTKLAQHTSQYYYFVLQSLHKVVLRTTKLAQSSTSYYKACTMCFPVLLCTTKLAQSTSHYYFVLQRSTKLTQNTFHLLMYHYLSLDVSNSNRFTMSICRRPIVLRTQRWRQATLTQPLQYDLRFSAAKHKSITLAAAAAKNLDAAITWRLHRLSCRTHLQNRISTPKQKETRF